MSRILIVDDDKSIAELVADSLEDEGFETVVLQDGEKALELLQKDNDFSLILLDIMMPKLSGIELCKQIRNNIMCPIIFMTAKNRTIDTVLGLEVGADDYITKPFEVEELVARIKAHIRREKRSTNVGASVISKNDLVINKDYFEVKKAGEKVDLTPREFQLLTFFMENAGKVFSKEELFEKVWNCTYGDIGTVAVNIKNLRDKVDPDSKYIKTIWGVGYKFIEIREEI